MIRIIERELTEWLVARRARKPAKPMREQLRDAMVENTSLREVEGYWHWRWKGPPGLFTQQVAEGVERTRGEAVHQIKVRLTPLGAEIFDEVYGL